MKEFVQICLNGDTGDNMLKGISMFDTILIIKDTLMFDFSYEFPH